MSIRRILFLLFLYDALAWLLVFRAYREDGGEVVLEKGLLWTAVGVAGVLLGLLVQQIISWWRLRRARAQSRPVTQEVAVRRVHEDDAALAGLIAEADNQLARAADGRPRRIRDLPLYLLIGPEGAGKTALLHYAGVDPRLLAGQVSGAAGPITSTRIANIWLANECIFVEVGGRLFQGDVTRLGEFLSVLRPRSKARGWRSLWTASAETPQLRGAILCCDLRGFLAAPDRANLERNANTVRERLLKISEIFGLRCPVYAVFTRADSIPFFAEFFSRMPEAEAGQPLGVLADAADIQARVGEAVWAEAENKRLSRDFNNLFLCLSTRRLLTLSQEPSMARKPSIYEFPREFKRLRAPVVQFLTDSLRPDPLGLSPTLRGFFYCGFRKVEADPNAPLETNAAKADSAVGATRIFRPEATQIFGSPQIEPHHRALTEKPVFSRDFFQLVLRRDRPSTAVEFAADPTLARRRLMIVGAAAAAAAVLAIVWTVSWLNNHELVNDVKASLAVSGTKIQDMSLESLRGLDNLRSVLVDRLDQPHGLSMNWGLYTGDRLREAVRRAYFARLRQLVLRDANAYIVDYLRRLDPQGNAEYDQVYNRLKTHITIAQAGCTVDAPLVRETLIQAVGEMRRDLDERKKELVDRQIDYYAASLDRGKPVSLTADEEAINVGRTYLKNSRGPEQIYAAILAEVRKGASRVMLGDRVGDYRLVMAAPDEVSFEFTKEGREKFEKLADSGKFNLSGEPCVLGTSLVGEKTASLEQIRQAKSIYYRRYKQSWEKFLDQTNVRGYSGTADGATKLGVLSAPDSPLLAIVKFVSDNTYFPASKPVSEGETGGFLGIDKFKKQVDKTAEKIEPLQKPDFGPADLTRIFQPAQIAVQPDARNLVTEKNKAYVEALRKLQENLEKSKNVSAADHDSTAQQGQEAYTSAIGAERSLADVFDRETEGVDRRLSDILLQPIKNAQRWLLQPIVAKPPWEDANSHLPPVCAAVAGVLKKYPFKRQAGDDLSLEELTHVFGPASLIWGYEAQYLKDFVAKNSSRWEPKPDAKAQVTPELLEFLNRAQAITDVFFAAGGQQLGLTYRLRPVAQQEAYLKLEIDGTTLNSKESALQKTFSWPAAKGAEGAAGIRLLRESGADGFGAYSGPWAVFRLFQLADERPLGDKIVTWSHSGGVNAIPQPMTPVVKVEFAQFPNGADVFNPKFFVPMRCPGLAVAPQ